MATGFVGPFPPGTVITTSTVSAPRIDRKFVDERGFLTQNAYALLYGLLTRTGGPVAPMIDVTAILTTIETAAEEAADGGSVSPPPVDLSALSFDELAMLLTPAHAPPMPDSPDPDARYEALVADIAALRQEFAGLAQGVQL